MTKENTFDEIYKAAIYSAIFNRRDIRSQFIAKPVEDDVLSKILLAAHHAPSVGFMQPWNFIVIKSQEIKSKIHDSFARANEYSSAMFSETRRPVYENLKLQGILESPINICVTCDKTRFGPTVIGRTTNPSMDEYSAVCAVENLWLAARAEGIGIGWVSILYDDDIKLILSLPKHVKPIAYLCLGYVTNFPDAPELETIGWLPRVKLEQLVYSEKWGNDCKSHLPELYSNIEKLDKTQMMTNDAHRLNR
ncbi:cob(II)yrinic acid a,c-diamide reductase [Candidatus Magnetoovum chiemensis]|nr:cob(II)yrinic acid a,c-diamide reductase [Candidatus Magnetoovum chiemensis]